MTITRRQFGKFAGVGTLALATVGLEGCPGAANVWTDIENWLPKGIASFEAIVTLVDPLAAPGIDAIAETVKAAFAVLSAAVDQYIAAPAANKATFLAKVQLAFQVVTQNINAFLAALNQSSNPIVKIALALATIILSTISAFIGKIGGTSSARLKLGGQEIVIVPVYRNRKQFTADFNFACTSNGHPELAIH